MQAIGGMVRMSFAKDLCSLQSLQFQESVTSNDAMPAAHGAQIAFGVAV
jgi:hypothetical protein